MSKKVKVFVYGTLRGGGSRNLLMAGKRLWEEAYLDGFQMLDLGAFPGIVPGLEGTDPIRGEIYEIPEEALTNTLDRIEGCYPRTPELGLYRREQVEAITGEGGGILVWVYIFNQSRQSLRRFPAIPSGDWFEHKGLYSSGEAIP